MIEKEETILRKFLSNDQVIVLMQNDILHLLAMAMRAYKNEDTLVKKLTLTDVVHTLKDCLIAQKPVEYKNKKHYLTTLEIMDSGEEICELMNTDTYEVISNVNGEEVKIF